MRQADQRGAGMHGRRLPVKSHTQEQDRHARRETRTHAAQATVCSGTGRPLQGKGTRARSRPGEGRNGWGGAHITELTARRKLVIAAWSSACLVSSVAMAPANRQQAG